MLVQPISDKQNFNGKVIVLGKISKTQNYLFNLHKAKLEEMMANKTYDLFVRQSKSGKTILLNTDKDSQIGYFVRKNKQNFEECTNYVINSKDKEIALQEQEKQKETLRNSEILYMMFHEMHNKIHFIF